MMNRWFLTAVALSMLSPLALAQGFGRDHDDHGGPGGPREGWRGGGMMRRMPLLRALDKNGDGTLSAQEIAGAAAALKTLDKNRDGKLTEDELRPEPPPGGFRGGPGGEGGPPPPDQLVNQLMAGDKNHDGKLTRAELPERMQGILARADANKDGKLDKSELTKFAAQRSGGPGGGFGGPPR